MINNIKIIIKNIINFQINIIIDIKQFINNNRIKQFKYLLKKKYNIYYH